MRPRRRFGSPRMRLLDLGTVPWMRSQSVHHAVARCFDDDTPDTLVIVRPDAPYLCVGRHRLGAPLSPAALRRSLLPVVRRGLGGGTVLITPDQTFFVFVVHHRRLALPDPDAFAWCLGAGAAAYRRLGVPAQVGPATDLHLDGRKLCGSGAATIGEASVFGGNVIHDFDAAPFVDTLHLPSATVRTVVRRELDAQMGSVRAAVGTTPAPGAVRAALRDGVEAACGVRLVPGTLTAVEKAAIPEVERWIGRVPRDRLGPDGRPPYWKVRAGAGVMRLTVAAARRTLVVTVRERRVADVVGESGAHRLAARVAPLLEGRCVDSPLDAGSLRRAGLDPATAGSLAGLLVRSAAWVT